MRKLKNPKCTRLGCPDLLLKDRQDMFRMRERGKSIREISEFLGFSKSTVHNTLNHPSLKKGSTKLPWYEKGKIVSDATRKNRGRKRKRYATLKNQEVLDYVELKLKDKYSPKSIAYSIRIDKPHLKISHEAIYQYIYFVDPTLVKYLTRKGKTRRNRNRTGKVARRAKPAASSIKKSVHSRTEEGNERLKLGHLEADFIVSCRGGKSCLLVVVDRKTRKVYLRLLPNREAETTRKAMFEVLSLVDANFKNSLKTLTLDNDTANNNLHHLEPIFKESELQILFCDPYKSWQKGTVEAINGILRRWFPKGTNFDDIRVEQVTYVENWFNNRPMDVLEGITPNMAHQLELQKAA